jgi:hypothetical protein
LNGVLVTLQSEGETDVLTLTARDAGALGDTIRARVDYATADPERTFNLTLFRRIVKPTDARRGRRRNRFTELSMNPDSADYVVTPAGGRERARHRRCRRRPGHRGRRLDRRADPAVHARRRRQRHRLGRDPDTALDPHRARHYRPGHRRALADRKHPQVRHPVQHRRPVGDRRSTPRSRPSTIPHHVDVTISDATVATGGIAGGPPAAHCLRRRLGPSCRLPRAATSTAGLGLGLAAGGSRGRHLRRQAAPAPTGIVARIGTSANTVRRVPHVPRLAPRPAHRLLT